MPFKSQSPLDLFIRVYVIAATLFDNFGDVVL